MWALSYLSVAFISPFALVFAPLAALLGFQRPRRRDAMIAAVLVGIVLWAVVGSADGFARFERAWVFLLTGGTVVALAIRPPQRAGVVSTALIALAAATAAGAVLMAATGFSLDELQWLAARHFGAQARLLIGGLAGATGGAPAPGVPAPGSEIMDSFEASAMLMVRIVSQLLPGLVLLQSLAALAIAWALYQWLAREPDGGPLPPLKDFRFNDHLIWGVVIALVALVLPGLGAAAGATIRVVGGDLAVFFGGLYVMRGLGVVLAFATASGLSGPVAVVFALAVTLFLAPVVVIAALVLGLTDTWVDWRRMTKSG